MPIVGFSKLIAGNPKTGIILPAGQAYCRKTNLTSGWRKAVIALIGSWTDLVGNDGLPPAEQFGATNEESIQSYIGLSNGPIAPGQAGSKFVGSTSSVANNWFWRSGNTIAIGNGSGSYGHYVGAGAIDGATVHRGNGTDVTTMVSDISADACCWAKRICIELQSDGNLIINETHWRDVTPAAQSEAAAMVQLNGFLTDSITDFTRIPTNYSVGGNWWSGSVDSGCEYLYLRYPMLSARLKLFGLQVMQFR